MLGQQFDLNEDCINGALEFGPRRSASIEYELHGRCMQFPIAVSA